MFSAFLHLPSQRRSVTICFIPRVGNAWHRCQSVALEGDSGQMSGKGPGLYCLNKDQAPCGSPTIHPRYGNILQVEVVDVFSTLPKIIADHCFIQLTLIQKYRKTSQNRKKNS